MKQNTLKHIKDRVAELPSSSGVYIMKGAHQKIIYIGKAKNLKSRVGGYFNNTEAYNHLASYILRHRVKEIDYVMTQNEKEALILEANLVKKHRPRYNIMLKDDKHYPYLKLTTSEPFPRVVVTRKRGKAGDKYYGPYTDVRSMRKTIRFIQKTFRIRDCNLKLPLKEPIKPCLTFHIGRCDAPCANMYTVEQYAKLVDEVALLLKGKNHDLLKSLQKQMLSQSRVENFEEAAKIRDQIKHIDSVLESQRMDLGEPHIPLDLIALARSGKVGCAVVLQVREGIVIDKKNFKLSLQPEQTLEELTTDFVKAFYLESQDIPREILLSHPLVPEENMETLLRELKQSPVSCKYPQKGPRYRQLELAKKNAEMLLVDYISHIEKKERENFSVRSLKEDLGLPRAPNVIEGFDISHLSGTDTVASLVVFEGGKPKKSNYRKFNVKTVAGIDDFKSMNEVFARRVKRLINEGKPFPDLFLIDGGKGQLSAAYEVLKEHGRPEQPIIGLAKRFEEVFKPGEKNPYLIPKSSASLKLLQRVRDESHRFAITFQKTKRKKYLQTSWLDEVPGIGPKLKEKLLQQLGSPSNIKNCNKLELQKVIGEKKGAGLFDHIHSPQTP